MINQMNPFKAIVFDLGNVVFTNDWHYDFPEKFAAFTQTFGVSEEAMEAAWRAHWPEFRLGKITEEDFWQRFLATAGGTGDISEAKRLWRKYQHPIQTMPELLLELHKNYRLAALTTISKEWLDYKLATYHLNDVFECVLSSGYLGVAKPNPEIYKMLLQKLALPANQIIYIDDSPRALEPATELGITTILFQGQSGLEAELARYSVVIA
jgi:HAD superfamily hydrolase (TIGR01509 family)